MKHVRISALTVLALLVSACSGDADTGAPVIAAFTAEPATVSVGGTSILTWVVEGDVTLLEITTDEQGDFYSPIDVTNRPSYAARPTETTTYILRARNAAGAVQEDVTVGVEAVGSAE